MNASIIGIYDRGVANRERLHLRILADTNLKYFVVFDTTVTVAGGVSSIPRHVYWFTDRPVKAGDNVFLFTGLGPVSSAPGAAGTTNHFLYWNQRQTLWAQPLSCALVLEIAEWATSRL